MLTQVKSFIDNNLNPAKVNTIDPTKDDFAQPLSIKEIVDDLEKDEDSELQLKRQPNSCFVDNYIDDSFLKN